MTLGLPGHLVRDSLSRAFAVAGHAAAFVCLGTALAVGVFAATIAGDPRGWAGAGIVLVMAAALALVARFPTVTFTVIYLVVGTGIVYGATVLIMVPEAGFETTNNAVLALPRTALVLVGGAGVGSAIAITWASLGYALGEAAVFLGVVIAGGVWAPNSAATLALVIVVIVRAFDGATRRGDVRRAAGLHRASEQTRELAIRHDHELRATARLHDTALSHLVAIAAAGSGPVDERIRAGIRQDLGLIVGRDWAIDHASHDASARSGGAVDAAPSVAAPESDVPAGIGEAELAAPALQLQPPADSFDDTLPVLVAAFSAAANAGLIVRVTGDFAVLGALGPRRAAALDAAVAQCLVNVARHAGVDEAELALGIGGGEVTVAVMDRGVGFDEQQVPSDRIGLRTSIRARIEQEQGTVRLWSTKGIGTTIVLTVPEGGE